MGEGQLRGITGWQLTRLIHELAWVANVVNEEKHIECSPKVADLWAGMLNWPQSTNSGQSFRVELYLTGSGLLVECTIRPQHWSKSPVSMPIIYTESRRIPTASGTSLLSPLSSLLSPLSFLSLCLSLSLYVSVFSLSLLALSILCSLLSSPLSPSLLSSLSSPFSLSRHLSFLLSLFPSLSPLTLSLAPLLSLSLSSLFPFLSLLSSP